jgi:putative transposase
MARPPRNERVGGWYHVVSRGSNRHAIVVDDDDRRAFCDRLARVIVRWRWVVYAYCLMTNHYHLVLRIPFGGLSGGMQVLNGGHSLRTNTRHGRVAHLFENRFVGDELEDELHVFRSTRYADLNPVRAGICGQPEDYRWSSYRSHAGLDVSPVPIATDELLGHFSSDLAEAREAYIRFVSEGHDPVSDTGSRPRRPW